MGKSISKTKSKKVSKSIASLENYTVVMTEVYISQGEKVISLGRKHLNTFD